MQDWIDNVPLLRQGYHETMLAEVERRRERETVYPPQDKIFAALRLTRFDDVRAVILGQDPYHGPGQAQGLSFSVPDGFPAPPSLRNIFKEIQSDCYPDDPQQFSNDLSRWAKQGVLLLNTSLSVAAGKAASHAKLGWARLTDDIIETLGRERQHLVFMLWGKHAQSKKALIDAGRHLILESVHPSPLSARKGFFGCRHFSQANDYLVAHGREPIRW